MKKILFPYLFILVLAAGAVAQPTGPHVFSGEVTINGSSVQDATVTARSNGNQVGSADVTNGRYDDLLVQGVKNQSLIKFYIDGLKTGQNYTYSPWNVTELNLSADIGSAKNYNLSSVKQNVSDGETVTVKAPEEASTSSGGVSGLNITVKKKADDVTVNVTVTDEKTTEAVNQDAIDEINDGDTEVEGVIDVDSNLNNSNIGQTTIGFKLKKSKIDNRPRSVVLIHFENGSRVGVLETTYLKQKTQNKNNNFYYFEAQTNSFSSFAMTSDSTDPQADAGDDKTVLEGLETDFDASGSTDNVEVKNYSWDFDDGDTAIGKSVTHKFDSGTYSVELTVYDTAGNKDTDTISVDVDTVSEEPSKSGSGSKKDRSNQSQDGKKSGPKFIDAVNTNGKAVGVVGNVSKNQKVNINLPGAASDTAVKAVSFRAMGSSQDVKVSIRGLSGKPVNIPTPSKRVKSYQEINLSGLSDQEVDGVEFNFTVEQSFVSDNNATVDEIKMLRYNNGEWNSLETSLIEKKQDSYLFKATSSGFSYYAIALEEGDSASTSGDQTNQSRDSNGTSTGNQTGDGEDVQGTGLGVVAKLFLIFLVALAVLLYYYRDELVDVLGSSGDGDSGDAEYTCDECGASFEDEEGLSVHMRELHDEGE